MTCPAAHAHCPAVHTLPAPQTVPQAPQFCALVVVSTHASPQKLLPAGQVQAPCAQVRPPLHALPHVPQLLLSVATLTQLDPQAVCPGMQLQTPAVHTLPASQLVPHAPQLVGLTWRSTQLPAQAARPMEQPAATDLQAPWSQTWSALQLTPQAPQFGFARVLVHTPPQATSPAAQVMAIGMPPLPAVPEAPAVPEGGLGARPSSWFPISPVQPASTAKTMVGSSRARRPQCDRCSVAFFIVTDCSRAPAALDKASVLATTPRLTFRVSVRPHSLCSTRRERVPPSATWEPSSADAILQRDTRCLAGADGYAK